MKDEIEEIIEALRDSIDDTGTDKVNFINWVDKIEDYITNLQEKVNQYENPDDLTLFYMWLDEKVKDKIKQLQEENERLKVKLENKLTPDELVSMLNQELDRQNKDYKSRNEKAIKYINRHYLNAYEPELLNILQGEDKE